jgi:uncharacterized protein
MKLSWDEAKRQWTLRNRRLDFAKFSVLFEGPHLLRQDVRRDYGEVRWIVLGFVEQRLMVAAYTMRQGTYHVFSMRKANEREKEAFKKLRG